MQSAGFMLGPTRIVDRNNIYEDVIDMYSEGEIVGEYPLMIKYKGEQAVDQGGVQRDMFSAFWAEVYSKLFEGCKTLTPLIQPGIDMTAFPIIGRVLSHGFLACGFFPVSIALPSLISMVLGPTVPIPVSVLMESFTDYISDFERNTLNSALKSNEPLSADLHTNLISILSRFGCREMPTRANLPNLIEQIALYEFCAKPSAVLMLIHSGIPATHKPFWETRSASDIHSLFYRMTVTSAKVIAMLEFEDATNELELRVCSYLTTMIGNLGVRELILFLRFVTGASACIVPKIKVEFNALSGLGRRPMAHTCSSTLELPTAYKNYEDFYDDFKAIFDVTKETYSWRMDAL